MSASAVLPHPQHSPGHIDCPACNALRARFSQTIDSDLTFTDAAARYMRLRSVQQSAGPLSGRYIRPKTEQDYAGKLRSVALFFGDVRLRDIHWYNMRAYQEARIVGEAPFIRKRQPHRKEPQRCPAKPKQINQEMALLKQLKVRASCWTTDDEAYFEYLQETESDDVQRALTPEEQHLWLATCRSNARWNTVLWWSLLSFHCCTGTNELRGLRIADVDLPGAVIRVPWSAAKNPHRRRIIPIEDPDALWALECLLDRARDLGAAAPSHYLFPFRVTRSRQADPTRPMTESGIKKLWEEVRHASGLTWFRPYDTRHTAATRLAESGVPVEVIMARMGHATDKMRQHYTHVTEQAQRAWLRPAAPRTPQRFMATPFRRASF